MTILLLFALQDGVEPTILPVEKEGEGLAAKFPGDAGIESHPKVVFHDSFETGDLKQWSSVKEKTYEFNDKTVHAGSKSLKMMYTPGKDTGGMAYKMFKPGYDTLYFRFYVFFPEGHGYLHHFNQILGYNPPSPWMKGGAGERPAGNERFHTGLDITGEGKPPPPGRWKFYAYWCEMKASGGNYWGNNPKHTKTVDVGTGRWICAEFMVKCNTLGKSDGEQAYWIDGQCVGRWGGYKWRTDAALNCNAVALEYYITDKVEGYYGVKNKPEHVFFDDVVVAQEYIGPMKGGSAKAAGPKPPDSKSPFSKDFDPGKSK